MNYLGRNLNNSSNLPYDVMKLINEYADPLIAVRKQIETGDYDLDEIMYERMKKYMLKNCIDDTRFRDYTLGNNGDCIFLNERNIDDKIYKDAILNWNCGYRNYFLWKHKRPTSICGLEFDKFNSFRKALLMVYDANVLNQILYNYNYNDSNTDFNTYLTREYYKLWAEL